MQAFFDKFAQIPLIQKVAGFVFLCAVAIAVYYFLLHTSTMEEIASVNAQILSKKNELSQIQQTMIKIKEYEAEAKRLEKKLEEALALLPEKSEIPNLLEKISNLAEKSGLSINSFKPMGEMPQDFYVQVAIDLDLSGSYYEIMNFFDAISKLRRVVNITNLNAKRTYAGPQGFMKDDAKTKMNVHCMGVTFRFKGD